MKPRSTEGWQETERTLRAMFEQLDKDMKYSIFIFHFSDVYVGYHSFLQSRCTQRA